MTKQTIGIGTVANDGTGDDIRDSFDKVNDNFNEVYGVSGVLKSNGSDTLSAASNLIYDNVLETYTKPQYFTEVSDDSDSAASNGTYDWDLSVVQCLNFDALGTVTLDISNPVAGATYILLLTQATSAGGVSVSFSSNFKFEGGTPPTQVTDSGSISMWSFYCDGTYLYGTGLIDFS